MRGLGRVGLVAVGLAMAQVGWGQAPASAPAGANGICKDGTYSTAASKDGACRGHKGVQTWYAAGAAKAVGTGAATKPGPVSAAPASSAAAPVAVQPKAYPPAAKPVPAAAASAPATATATPKQSGPGATAAAKAQAPGGGAGMVWVNTASNVYHCPGTDFYGKTKAGSYMSEADAKAKGARGNRGKGCGL